MAVSRIVRARGVAAASMRRGAVVARHLSVLPNDSGGESLSMQRRCFASATPSDSSSPSSARGMLLLEQAAIEAKKQLGAPLRASTTTSATRQTQQVDDAMNAVESLLASTNATTALSESIRLHPTSPQVVCLHRAFLTLTQWCVQLSCPSNGNAFESHLAEHPLLDSVLQLAVRSHQLHLNFTLPLYKSMANAIAAQPSIHSPSSWILQIAQWCRVELGHLPDDFFDESLQALTARQKSNDAVTVLQAMHRHLHINEINETATKEILLNLKGSIRSMWKKTSGLDAGRTGLSRDCLFA